MLNLWEKDLQLFEFKLIPFIDKYLPNETPYFENNSWGTFVLRTILDEEKMKLSTTLINDIRDYASSIVDSEPNFYRSIAQKFGISTSSAYLYAKDIKKTKN